MDSIQKLLDPFFTTGRHNDFDVFCLSQSYFGPTERTLRNISNILIFFQQTFKDVNHIYREIAGSDMSNDKFNNLCRVAWKDIFTYLSIKEARR